LYPNDSGLPGNGLLAVRLEDKLLAIAVEKVIVATGGAPQPVPFPGVDRPGVHAARGLLKLHAECGVRVGARLAVVGDGKELVDCARALRRAGYELARVVSATPELPPAEDLPLVVGALLRALGDPVRALEIAAAGGAAAERIGCDAVALAWSPAPLHELASSNGAAAAYLPELNGSPLLVDKDGRTTVPWIFAAGRACGLGGAGAVPSGEAAGAAACK
jgi:pyruvate/2-oxoglutarate dehydrogenase complex dihydrolipoamide dehydrogenase (E3) component